MITLRRGATGRAPIPPGRCRNAPLGAFSAGVESPDGNRSFWLIQMLCKQQPGEPDGRSPFSSQDEAAPGYVIVAVDSTAVPAATAWETGLGKQGDAPMAGIDRLASQGKYAEASANPRGNRTRAVFRPNRRNTRPTRSCYLGANCGSADARI